MKIQLIFRGDFRLLRANAALRRRDLFLWRGKGGRRLKVWRKYRRRVRRKTRRKDRTDHGAKAEAVYKRHPAAERKARKKAETIYYIKQKLSGLTMAAIGIITPILLDGDATFSLIALPLGIWLLFTKEKVMMF